MAIERERYRKISTRMYGDDKYLELSPLLPSGQGLWGYLLTGPHTTAIPGLFSAGRAQLAEALGWSQEDFDRCWAEIEAKGLGKADWRRRVVWLPNAIRHNIPESPSVVVAWRDVWPFIPECGLKWDAYRTIRAFLETVGDSGAYVKAFVSACLEPAPQADPQAAEQAAPQAGAQPDPQPVPHQEQEQEQEQEKRIVPASPTLPCSPEVVRTTWNAVGPPVLPEAITLTEKRQRAVKARLGESRDRVETWWRTYFSKIRNTPFLCGDNDRGWRADFDFAIKADSITKVHEGKYDRAPAKRKPDDLLPNLNAKKETS